MCTIPRGIHLPYFYISLSDPPFYILLPPPSPCRPFQWYWGKGSLQYKGKGKWGVFYEAEEKRKGAISFFLVHRSESGFAKCPQSPGLQRYSRWVLGEMSIFFISFFLSHPPTAFMRRQLDTGPSYNIPTTSARSEMECVAVFLFFLYKFPFMCNSFLFSIS